MQLEDLFKKLRNENDAPLFNNCLQVMMNFIYNKLEMKIALDVIFDELKNFYLRNNKMESISTKFLSLFVFVLSHVERNETLSFIRKVIVLANENDSVYLTKLGLALLVRCPKIPLSEINQWKENISCNKYNVCMGKKEVIGFLTNPNYFPKFPLYTSLLQTNPLLFRESFTNNDEGNNKKRKKAILQQHRKQIKMFSSMDDVLTLEIFSYLDVSSLINMNYVCQDWHRLINTPGFISSQIWKKVFQVRFHRENLYCDVHAKDGKCDFRRRFYDRMEARAKISIHSKQAYKKVYHCTGSCKNDKLAFLSHKKLVNYLRKYNKQNL